MDVEKQIDYWKTGSQEDLAAARHLMDKDHCRHALFFAHLAVEKALKAHVCRSTNDLPPRIHNLTLLAQKAALSLDAAQQEFLLAFDEYQLESRYPDVVSEPVAKSEAQEQLANAKRVQQWLISRL